MRIRNRALTFSAFSSTLFSDPSSIPEIKHQHGKQEKGHEHEGEEEMHMNPGHEQLNRSYYSNHSHPPPKKDRSRSKEEDQLRQVNGEIYEQGCKNCTEISSRLLPYQEDFATVEEGEGDEEELWSASHKSRSKNLGAQSVGGGAVSGARWSGRESVFPLKKRKNKYEFMVVGSSEKKKNKSKKKKQRKKEEEEEEDDNTSGDQRVINVKKVKKNNSKSREMEGSRCSRVNGRGWRCCQATLVGYSLCEHHLGKGRLKSINNSLGQSSSSTNTSGKTIRSPKKEQVIEDEDDKEMKTKKKKRAGVVKARSMSSLLG